MNEWDLAEQVEKMWDDLPKNLVMEEKDSSRLWMATQCGSTRLYLSVIIGPRGGAKECLIVFSTEGRILADRILFQHIAPTHSGKLLRSFDIHGRKTKDKTYVQVCREIMEEIVNSIQADPQKWEPILKLYKREDLSTSPVFLTGGATGLGKGR